MKRVLLTIAWRSALCAAFAWAAWRWGGLGSMVYALALFGVVLAKPLIDLASELRHGVRVAVWKPVEGRYYAYHGHRIEVVEDADHCRWVRAADVRRVVGFTASDGALALSYPSGWRAFGKPPEPHFSDEALLLHLAKERSAEAIRFKNWAEREIFFPARRERERNGIRLPAPTAPPRD